MADEDGIPPLEDMTPLVQRVKEIELKKEKSISASGSSVLTNKPETKTLEKETLNEAKKSFGGMQKGFLFGSKPKPSKPNVGGEKEPDYVVKRKENKESHLVFDDVQNAMKETGNKLLDDKTWITEDLLKSIESNDDLLKQLSDPKFNQAIQWMQKDPKGAMEYYKDDAQVQLFFKQFYKILGQHFTELADIPDKGNGATSSNKADTQMTEQDKNEMDRILSDPEIKSILMKPDIQNLFTLLKTEPDKVQQLLQTCEPRMRSDIQKLVEARLLDFQQQ
ncbi:uncharacterized protein LOC101242455 [Ciona intestinalis]